MNKSVDMFHFYPENIYNGITWIMLTTYFTKNAKSLMNCELHIYAWFLHSGSVLSAQLWYSKFKGMFHFYPENIYNGITWIMLTTYFTKNAKSLMNCELHIYAWFLHSGSVLSAQLWYSKFKVLPENSVMIMLTFIISISAQAFFVDIKEEKYGKTFFLYFSFI